MTLHTPRRFALVAPPPTPNGDLHVGHLSGPYFGLDVLARYLSLRGHIVETALGVDINQTYVVTTAERLSRPPLELAEASHTEIRETLKSAGIGFAVVGLPDQSYSDYVTSWFERLHAAGAFRLRRRAAPFDSTRDRFMFEAYASGYCPHCLAPTKANICEGCGHANEASDLFKLHPTGGALGDPIVGREIAEYVLDLEDWREPLLHHFKAVIPEMRPALGRLIDEMFARALPSFPITFPSAWGIPAPFPGANGLILNVWAEMVPGHYHWLNEAARRSGRCDVVGADSKAETRYYQFLGFDNSFFYVVAHLALALAARKHGVEALIPDAFVTNEFLQLESDKFSTSQGHLIWGRDLLADEDCEDVRFYLAWINPEYNQSSFTRANLREVAAAKLREPLKNFLQALSEWESGLGQPMPSEAGLALSRRFEAAYEPRSPSLRIAAQTIYNGLNLGVRLIASGTAPGEVKSFASALAAGTLPIAPTVAATIWACAGGVGPITWPGESSTVSNDVASRRGSRLIPAA